MPAWSSRYRKPRNEPPDGMFGRMFPVEESARYLATLKSRMRIRDQIPVSVRMWLLRRRQRQVEAEHRRTINDLRKNKAGSEDIRAAEYESWYDDLHFDNEILQIQSRQLINLAGKYVLPYPETADWEEEPQTGHRYLKREVLARLRSAIRAEQKERWDHWYRWLPVLTAITGVLGAVIGVISSLRR